MAEATSTEKRAIRQQASALLNSMLSQERAITYLRSLDLPRDDLPAVQNLAELIDSLQLARQDLAGHFDFLGVAHDHGWDAARIYHEEPDDSSKRIQSAVTKAKKKKESEDKERKKKKKKRCSSSTSSSSSSKHRQEMDNNKSACSHAASHCHCQPACQRPTRSNSVLGKTYPVSAVVT